MKGIEFGNDQVESWLVSFLFSIFIGIFVTQPLQVWFSWFFSKYSLKLIFNSSVPFFLKIILMNFIVVIVCRKYDSSQDFETEKKEYTNNENKTRVRIF